MAWEVASGGLALKGVQGVVAKDLAGRDVPVSTVRNVGSKTFYYRENRWVDAAVTPEEEKTAIPIEQYSDAYFKLARDQDPDQNLYLTFNEPVTVELDGKVYRIDPPKG